MSRVVAIGAPLELLGWTLAGVALIEASDPEQVRLAWSGLDADVGLAVLTPAAREALPVRLDGPVLWAVLPS